MSMSILDNPDLKKIRIASHPTRMRILNDLTRYPRLYTTELAKTLNTERKVVGFHLSALEQAGLVISEFGLTQTSAGKRPVAARFYTITPKGKEIYENLLSMLKR
jgi:DNA-binding transcriptional ArsR family regulator